MVLPDKLKRTANDEKPRVILDEHRVTNNITLVPTLFDEKWSMKNFKKRCHVVIVKSDDNTLEFDLIGVHPGLANAFRRIMLSQVPSMAIEKVHVLTNTSIIQDEVLAHRLGLVPLKADPRQFSFKSDPLAEGTEKDTLEYTLKIKCSHNKDSNKDSLRVEDMYKNNNVYSKHIKWSPIGNQRDTFREEDVGPILPDILLAKMRPGNELDLKLVAVKGTGYDHAKFQPVCTAYYRTLPDIKLIREVEGEAAERLQTCFSPGVIEIKHEGGRKYAVVANSRYDASSRNHFRFADLADAVIATKVQDHFIFTVESVGALKPEDIFVESVKILRDKCLSLLDELNSN